MGKHGPRKCPRDKHGFTMPPTPSGVTNVDIEKPKHIADDPVASAVFDKLVGYLAQRGDLRKSHELALGLLAGEWSRHVGAARIARETTIVDGPRGPKAHPAASVAAAAARVARDLLADFGLTPASLARIDVPTDPSGPSEIDRFVARRAGTKVTRDDRDLSAVQRHTLLYGTEPEKGAVVDDVVQKRRLSL